MNAQELKAHLRAAREKQQLCEVIVTESGGHYPAIVREVYDYKDQVRVVPIRGAEDSLVPASAITLRLHLSAKERYAQQMAQKRQRRIYENKDIIDAWNSGKKSLKEIVDATGRWYGAVYNKLQMLKRLDIIK